MLITIEKVLALKTVGIFAETPDGVLAEVATIVEEGPVVAGEMIFEKGDAGHCMYIVVAGEVRIHDGISTLNQLGPGDVFGEMALLDPAPRMASATAVTDGLLLRLAQQPLYELMEEHSEVARGLIRVLCRRLRARADSLAEAERDNGARA